MVMTGRLRGPAEGVSLAGLIAVAILVANGLPDAESDRIGGAHTLASALGTRGSRALISTALGAAAVLVIAVRGRLGQSGLALLAAGMVAAGALVPLMPRGGPRIAFPLLAVVAGGATVTWLAA